MVERIVAAVCLALLEWIDKRIAKGTVSADADVDRDRLRLAGDRIRVWVQQQNRVRAGGQPDSGGSADKG